MTCTQTICWHVYIPLHKYEIYCKGNANALDKQVTQEVLVTGAEGN